MASVQYDVLKWLNFVLIVAVCFNFSAANLQRNETFHFNFEQIKNDLFLNSDFDNQSKVSVFNSRSPRANDAECLKQLNDIQNGLTKFEPWAMKSKLYLIDRKVLKMCEVFIFSIIQF